ncbi:MAG TPA: HAD hydrolase-like protein, partial [Candidatus Omnitrophota bacterium]|nr:HAD hydrolase-like protein [Candidatus Omnitrophota bacterium]
EKLSAALNILIKGGKFIACNEDARFPVGDGMYRPGCGAMVGAIAAASGKKPDFVVGKPNTYILSRISGDFCVRNDEIMVVGDSYESDIAMALSCDCHAVLLSGGSRRINRDDRVMVIQNIAEILHYMRRGK